MNIISFKIRIDPEKKNTFCNPSMLVFKLVESLESVPQQSIIFLDTVLIIFTAEKLFCYHPSLIVLAYVREKK